MLSKGGDDRVTTKEKSATGKGSTGPTAEPIPRLKTGNLGSSTPLKCGEICNHNDTTFMTKMSTAQNDGNPIFSKNYFIGGPPEGGPCCQGLHRTQKNRPAVGRRENNTTHDCIYFTTRITEYQPFSQIRLFPECPVRGFRTHG